MLRINKYIMHNSIFNISYSISLSIPTLYFSSSFLCKRLCLPAFFILCLIQQKIENTESLKSIYKISRKIPFHSCVIQSNGTYYCKFKICIRHFIKSWNNIKNSHTFTNLPFFIILKFSGFDIQVPKSWIEFSTVE